MLRGFNTHDKNQDSNFCIRPRIVDQLFFWCPLNQAADYFFLNLGFSWTSSLSSFVLAWSSPKKEG